MILGRALPLGDGSKCAKHSTSATRGNRESMPRCSVCHWGRKARQSGNEWRYPLKIFTILSLRWIRFDERLAQTYSRLTPTPFSRRKILGPLLNATIARTIVQSEKLAILAEKKSVEESAPRAPLHPILLMRALSSAHGTITRLLWSADDQPFAWNKVMLRFRGLGSDPSWRRRPSVLDRIQGLTAPPNPQRRAKHRSFPQARSALW